MTISDKIRIYELSRNLNLDNKDILDAAQKLSISVKSHSSSISAEEAKKIKNLIDQKYSDKKILSINKPLSPKDNYKQKKEDKSTLISPVKGKSLKDSSSKKPLLKKPLNKPDSQKIIPNQLKNPIKPNIISSSKSQANLTNKNLNSKTAENFNQDKKTFRNNTTPPIKSLTKPPIQLIEKPKNLTNNVNSNKTNKDIYNLGNKRQRVNKSDQNSNKPKTNNFKNSINPPELVGAPIRRDNPYPNKPNNKQNISFKQPASYRPGTPNRPGMTNKPGLRKASLANLIDKSIPVELGRQIDLECPIGQN